MPKVAVVILHYEDAKLTNQCVDSVKATSDADIIVVDNCSPTSYHRPDVINLRTQENRNVRGMNYGFYYALKQNEYDYIVNFDNDIICQENWLLPLVKVMEKHPTCGIVGGKQWNKEMDRYNSVGADLMGMIWRNTPDFECSVVWLQGSFHMYRVKMMQMIGLHDERYETICSDCDYCIHAIDRGWKVYFTPDSNVIHIGNVSYGGVPVASEKIDKLLFLQKWFGIKFCALTKTFPFDLQRMQDIYVAYKIDKDKSVYHISAVGNRHSTEEFKNRFNGNDIEGVEVGAMMGNNADSLLSSLPNLKRLHLIDNNTDGWMPTLRHRFRDNPKVNIIQKNSVEAAREFNDKSLDFVYIDADHSYKAVDQDIKAWLPKVKDGGIIAGHDYVKPAEEDKVDFDVIGAVNDNFGDRVNNNSTDWWVYL